MRNGLQKLAGRPVLITGGAGFVGSHIAARLSRLCPVYILDDLSTGSLDRIPAGVEFHRGDVRSLTDIERVLDTGEFAAVVHCAAQTSVAKSMREPDLDWEINVLGTQRLARSAAKRGVHRFVFVSSGGAIYGETKTPAVESDLPAPRSFYGFNKLAAEQLVRIESESYAILRPSNIYGPGQRSDLEGGVVAIFLERLLTGQQIDLHGGGDQRRDFVHVDDVVDAVEAALSEPDNVIWNVASGQSTSIVDLHGLLSELTEVRSQPVLTPRREGDVYSSLLSPARLMASGWGPPTSLRSGLDMLVSNAAHALPRSVFEKSGQASLFGG